MNRQKHQGFSLIEVLVAVAILSFGLLAVASLQGRLLNNTSRADERTGATAIGQGIIDHMREILVLGAGSKASLLDVAAQGRLSFDEIVTGNPSTIAIPGTGSATTIARGSTIYTPSWTVDNYYRNADRTAFTTTQTSALPAFKRLTVTVTWPTNEVDPDTSTVINGTVVLQEIIPQVAPGDSGILIEDQELGGGQPNVAYTPQPAPEVVRIPTLGLGGGRYRETTEPAPDILRNDFSTLTTFSTVTFDEDAGDFFGRRREDFLIVNCRCVLDTSGVDTLPEPYVWTGTEYVEALKFDTDGNVVAISKNTGTVASSVTNQPQLCTDCCANHHDGTNSVQLFDPFRVADRADGDHNHYLAPASANDPPTLANNSEEYDEVCRFVRVDGFFELTQDFQAVAFNVMPQDQLETSADLTTYQNYVIDVITEYVENLAADCDGPAPSSPTCYPGVRPDVTDVTAPAPEFPVLSINVTAETTMAALDVAADALGNTGAGARDPQEDTQPTLNQDDVDGDGFLSDTELVAFRTEMGFKPFMSRMIYIDYINNYVANPGLDGSLGLRDCIETRQLDPANVPDNTPSYCDPAAGSFLDITPFYEINTTGLSSWSIRENMVNQYLVLNQAIEDDNEREYLRGDVRLFAAGGNNVFIGSEIEGSNSGLTDSDNVDPQDIASISFAEAPIEDIAVTIDPVLSIRINASTARARQATFAGLIVQPLGFFTITNGGVLSANPITGGTPADIDCANDFDVDTLLCTVDPMVLETPDLAFVFAIGGYNVDEDGDGAFDNNFVCAEEATPEADESSLDVISVQDPPSNSGTTSEATQIVVGGANDMVRDTFPNCDFDDADMTLPDCPTDLNYAVTTSVKRTGNC